MTATIPCKDCPYIKTCVARLTDRTVTGCGMALFTNGMIKYDEIGVEHTVNAESEVQDADDADTETWNGYHGQVTAPKGTFKRIYEDADGGDA